MSAESWTFSGEGENRIFKRHPISWFQIYFLCCVCFFDTAELGRFFRISLQGRVPQIRFHSHCCGEQITGQAETMEKAKSFFHHVWNLLFCNPIHRFFKNKKVRAGFITHSFKRLINPSFLFMERIEKFHNMKSAAVYIKINVTFFASSALCSKTRLKWWFWYCFPAGWKSWGAYIQDLCIHMLVEALSLPVM